MEFFLTQEDFVELCRLKKYDSSARVRERASTLLLLHSGRTCEDVADILMINPRTVGTTRRDWKKDKFNSLPDKPRCGAPSILSDEEKEKILEIAKSSPLTADGILEEFVKGGGQQVGIHIIRSTLKKSVYLQTRPPVTQGEALRGRLRKGEG